MAVRSVDLLFEAQLSFQRPNIMSPRLLFKFRLLQSFLNPLQFSPRHCISILVILRRDRGTDFGRLINFLLSNLNDLIWLSYFVFEKTA